MGTELQKQTSAALTFERQPEEYLLQLEAVLVTLQDAYRSKLSDPEQQLWIRALTQGEEKFSIQEILAAVDEMVKNPPVFQVQGTDGQITQKWRGMPKLPDLIDVMLDLREKKATEWRKQEAEKQRRELRELKKRRDEHPEEFIGMDDLSKAAKEILGMKSSRDKNGIVAPAICKAMPNVRTVWPDIDPDRNKEKLERQKEKLLK